MERGGPFIRPELVEATKQAAARLGVSPVDLATVISYETGGTFDPWKAGPTTQWGQHRGLIQWGEPQRQKYGVFQGMSDDAQLQATERYLRDAGVKPGHGLLDLYSAVNAGRVGRYGASDAHNGGAPGTVSDKVASMEPHRAKVAAVFGDGQPTKAQPVAFSPQTVPGAAVAAPTPGLNSDMALALATMAPPPDSPALTFQADSAQLAPVQQDEGIDAPREVAFDPRFTRPRRAITKPVRKA